MPSPQPDFSEILSSYRQYVWPHIQGYLTQISQIPSFCQLPTQYLSLLDFHQQIVSDYPLRQGKYFRPTLLLLTAQSMGLSPDLALNTACAMQMSEDWILNHDDIEDDSLQRRGQPALHRMHGVPLAINAGDALHALMWKALLDNYSILDPSLAKAVSEEFFHMLNRTILGQTIELKWTKENKNDLSLEDILLILESKTGYYTIAGPMRLGAILAGSNLDHLQSLYDFGVTLGKSFQITDDLLDLTSDFSGLKKQRGNDIYEGKKTVMLIHLLNSLPPASKSKLEQVLSLSRSQKTPGDVDWVIDQMQKQGSMDYARQLSQKFAKQAKAIFASQLSFLCRQPFRHQLELGIDFVINRHH